MELDRIGIQFFDRPGLAEQIAIVRRAEALGYTSAWVTETRLVRDAVSVLGALAASTSRIQLGAAVVNTWTRGPVLMALTFATLHELAPGRMALGLGAYSDPLAAHQGVRRVRPLRQMREYIDVVRRLLALDGPVTYDGEVVQITGMELDLGYGLPRDPIAVPIYVGATGPRMMRLAGEIADGVIFNGFMASRYTREARGWIRSGAVAAGRDDEALDCPQLVRVAMSTDADEASAAARRMATMYLGGQPHVARAAGVDPELAARLAELVGGWPPTESGIAAAMRLVDQELVDELVVWGSPARCRERLGAWVSAGASYPVVSSILDNVHEVCEALAPGSHRRT